MEEKLKLIYNYQDQTDIKVKEEKEEKEPNGEKNEQLKLNE